MHAFDKSYQASVLCRVLGPMCSYDQTHESAPGAASVPSYERTPSFSKSVSTPRLGPCPCWCVWTEPRVDNPLLYPREQRYESACCTSRSP